ncbi:MAG: hypothetical protein ACRDNZ_20515 [Streptosporangiaceae bacterium]
MTTVLRARPARSASWQATTWRHRGWSFWSWPGLRLSSQPGRQVGRTMLADAGLEEAADEILGDPGMVCVTGFEVEQAPPELRAAGGRSLYARPGGTGTPRRISCAACRARGEHRRS